jgi:O-antigen/teichoic acid export membrane protein
MFIASIAMPFFALSLVRAAILQGLRRVILARLPELLAQPVALLVVLSLILAAQVLTSITAMAAVIMSMLISFVAGTIMLKTALKNRAQSAPPRYEDRRWIKSLLPFSAIGIVSYVNTEVFVPLVGYLSENEQVAYFKVALSLALLVALPLALVESVTFPHVARLYSQRARDEVIHLTWIAGIFALVISLPVVILIAIFGDSIIGILYGDEYLAAYLPLVLLSAAFAVVNLVGPSMQLLYATDFEKDALVISILSVVVIAALSVLWIPKYGALGAAGVFSIAKVARAFAFRWWAHRRLSAAIPGVEESSEVHK